MLANKLMLRGASALALGLATFGVTATAQPALAQAASTAEGRIPAGEFVKAPNMQQVRIAPDGSKLAYTTAKDGVEVLVVLDLETMKETPILATGESRDSGDRTVEGYRWIGNNNVVMTIFDREDMGAGADRGGFVRLVSYNVAKGELVQQAWRDAGGNASDILHIDHDAGKYLLQRDAVAETTERWGLPEVVEVDVETGRFARVQRTNPVVSNWSADRRGNLRFGSSYDRKNGKQRILYRGEDGGNFRTVYNEADETFAEGPPTPQWFIPGTDYAYATSNHEDVTKIYKIDLNTMEPVETVYETEGFDMDGLVVARDGSKVLGYRTFDGRSRIEWIDEDMKTVHGLLEEVFGKDEATIVDYTNDLSKVVVYGGGSSKNGGYYLYDTRGGSLNLLNWSRTGVKDSPLNPVKAEWYTASDGVRMQAIVTYPRHRMGQKNLPVVVMPHGGPFGATSYANVGAFAWNQALAEQGYVVIEPNYRGSGGYGAEFVKLGRRPGGYGKRMQDDLNDALAHFASEGVVDSNRACIMGWSYGGYAAARGAQRDAGTWQCAIAGAGVYEMPMMNRWDERNLGRFSRGFQATSDDPEGISPALNTDGDWAPILIVAAKRDARIPMEQAEVLVSNLKRSGKVEGRDFRYVVQEQGTHNLPYDDVHMEWIDEAVAWLDKYNPAYTASDGDTAPPLVSMN